MSINNILRLLKKFWSAFLLGTFFLVLGLITVIGLLIYIPSVEHTKGAWLVILVGMALGILELVESVRLFKIPFKNK